jgi:ribose transport system ATP-binding protein
VSGASASGVVLRVERVSKTFPGTRALDRVTLELSRGEIHALVGNNGSGKSTLIKILAGVHAADPGGEIRIGAHTFDAARFTPELARASGLHFVHQVPALFPMLTVAENMAIGRGFETAGLGTIRWQKQRERAARLIERFHIHATPDVPVALLEPADRTLVAIARALQDQEGEKHGVLFLDEPTAALPGPEVERLLSTLRRYAAAGQTIVYVSHRLDEVLRTSDRVSALRDGRLVATVPTAGMTENGLVELMLGHAIDRASPSEAQHGDKSALLRVKELSGGPMARVSFELDRGEIVGIAGLIGSGSSHVLRTLFGAEASREGEIALDGKRFIPAHPADAIAEKVAYLPPDRALDASFNALSVRMNLSATDVGRYFAGLRLRHDRERADARIAIERFMIGAASDIQPLYTLSGGNQQKVVLGKWLAMNPKILILDEPTRGIDVGAKAEIYRHMATLAGEGIAIIMVSSDMEEILGMSDRVVVMHEKRVKGVLAHDELSQERIATLMTGASRGAAA